jgi:hypothetical protein
LCPSNSCSFVASRTGTRGRFFHVGAREESTCSAYVSLRLLLQVPAGVDYDLHVSGACQCVNAAGGASCSSLRGTGLNDEIIAYCNDSVGDDDTFTANVEVRYFSGASCTPWTLSVYAGGC